ncbi:MAG: hypothetical protein KDM63_20210, partial [Verrucomicrobiae bacterium]|nr:hypothetical protein [Verrucomicrobiae bacterium]
GTPPNSYERTRFNLELPFEIHNPTALLPTESAEISMLTLHLRQRGSDPGKYLTFDCMPVFQRLESVLHVEGIQKDTIRDSAEIVRFQDTVTASYDGSAPFDLRHLDVQRVVRTNEKSPQVEWVMKSEKLTPTARIREARTWARLSLRPGSAVAEGIHRFSLPGKEEFQHSTGRDPETRSSVDYLSVPIQYQQLLFRLNRNPALRYFGELDGTQWFALLLDAEGQTIGDEHEGHLNRLYQNVVHSEGSWGSPLSRVKVSFPLPNDRKAEDFQLAIVRLVPVGKRPVEIVLPEMLTISGANTTR